MKKNVIAALLPVVGLAAMAAAQTSNAPVSRYTNSYGIMEVRWAVDGDGRNEEAYNPIAASLVNLTPGQFSTAVGLTLQARIATTAANSTIPASVAGQGNYGIGRVSFGTSNSYNRIRHNDTVAGGNIARGQTFIGTGSSATSSPIGNFNLYGATNEFRSFTGGYGSTRTITANWNSANGNPVAFQNLFSGNAQTTGSQISLNAVLNGSNRVRVSNGFQESFATSPTVVTSATLGTQIAAFDASISANQPSENITNFTNLGTTGVFSPWANLYRVVFEPRVNNTVPTDPTRNVTITFNGNVQYVSAVSNDTGPTLPRVDSFLGNGTDAIAVATFQIPTPATAALLGLGGLMAARRRRA